MHTVHINVFVVRQMVVIFCTSSTPMSGECARCSRAVRQFVADQRMWILGWANSMGLQNTFLTGYPGWLFDSTLLNPCKNILQTELQVKPTMRSPALTDDGVDERRQTSRVVNKVHPQGILELT